MMNLVRALMHPRRHRWLVLRPWKRHSLVLLITGGIFICIGWTYILTESTSARVLSLKIAVNIMPIWAWGVIFIISGSLAMLSARWPEASEKWGYSAMAGLSAWWSCCYLAGVVLGAPGSSLSGFLIWALLPVMLWAISGLDNPHERVKEE